MQIFLFRTAVDHMQTGKHHRGTCCEFIELYSDRRRQMLSTLYTNALLVRIAEAKCIDYAATKFYVLRTLCGSKDKCKCKSN
jgi:hypothetical protein